MGKGIKNKHHYTNEVAIQGKFIIDYRWIENFIFGYFWVRNVCVLMPYITENNIQANSLKKQ